MAREVRATRVVTASPEVIFDLLADPAKHALIDGSGTVDTVRRAPQRLAAGSTFSMAMRWGIPYATTNHVVEFVEGRRIAWHHFARFTWRYELEPLDGGTTRVTESFDYSVPWGVVLPVFGIPERNRQSMEATLERIESVVTTPPDPAP